MLSACRVLIGGLYDCAEPEFDVVAPNRDQQDGGWFTDYLTLYLSGVLENCVKR
jgi:hypothetical protein